jgi:hypothetical protein
VREKGKEKREGKKGMEGKGRDGRAPVKKLNRGSQLHCTLIRYCKEPCEDIFIAN